MKTRHAAMAVSVLAIMLLLVGASAAVAADQPFPSVRTAGGVWITQADTTAFATFAAEAVGPAAPGEDHQPAKGRLIYSDEDGLWYVVSIQHIHAHSGTEVHFGGAIVKASDPSLVGMHAHMVAIDNGARGDEFSVLLTASGEHGHAPPVPVERGNLTVKVR